MLAEAPNPSEQLDEWNAYYRLEPFGQARGDMQAGIVANMLRGAHGLDMLEPSDYVLDFTPRERKMMTPEQIEAVMMTWAGAHNANCAANG